MEEEIGGKNRYIITFKKKEMRKDKELDKTEILQQSVGPRLDFVDVGKQAVGFAPPDDPEGLVALEINDYELPMVFAALTDGEAGVLSKDPNIAAVEPDGKVYALDFPYFEMSEGGMIGDLAIGRPQTDSVEGLIMYHGAYPE